MKDYERLLKQKQYRETVLAIERTILHGSAIPVSILNRLPDHVVESSPILMRHLAEHLLERGDLPGAVGQLGRALGLFAEWGKTFKWRCFQQIG